MLFRGSRGPPSAQGRRGILHFCHSNYCLVLQSEGGLSRFLGLFSSREGMSVAGTSFAATTRLTDKGQKHTVSLFCVSLPLMVLQVWEDQFTLCVIPGQPCKQFSWVAFEPAF